MMRVRTIWSGMTGAPYLTVFHFMPVSAEDNAAADAAILATDNFWQAYKTQFLSTFSWVVQGYVDVLSPITGIVSQQFGRTARSGVGTSAAFNLEAPQVQGLVKWTTGDYVDGRAVVGRTFIPGVTVNIANAAGAPAGGIIGNTTVAVTALVTTPTLVDFCVWQRPRDARPAEAGTANHPPIKALPQRNGSSHLVTAGTLSSKFSHLRSRRD